MRIEIVKESVVFQKTDAIVNAANATMLGGGAVDGAIHDAAGPELYEFFNRQRKMWKAATRLAISTVRDWLEQHHSNILVKFCCYTDREFDCYQEIAEEIGIYG